MNIAKLEKLILIAATVFIGGAHAQSNRATLEDSRPAINNIYKAGQVGVGLQLGSLSGLTLDYWNTSQESWNASLLNDYGNMAIGLGHRWMFPNAFTGPSNVFVPYVGAGALMAFGNRDDYFASRSETFAVAVQVPLGLEFLPSTQRFGVFAELIPSLELTPVIFGFFNGDVGARFYF